jgi:hypothetical protein
MTISVEGTGTYQLEVDQENTWEDAVECVTLFFAEIVSKKPTGVLEHYSE